MKIVPVDAANYPRFADMLFWRETGNERTPAIRLYRSKSGRS